MKVSKTTLFVFFLFSLVFIPLSGAKQYQMSVQVKNGQARSSPSFLSKIIVTLSYGARVDIIEEKNSWFQIKIPGTTTSGWMHTTALTPNKIILSAGTEEVNQAATRDELVLAGKGFNKQVEGEFKAKNPQLDYTLINAMEQVVVSQAQIEQFLKEGELSPKGVE